jgi:serine O-acetyltransferase
MSNLKKLLMKDIGRFKDLDYLKHSSNASIRIFLIISRYFITNSAFRSILFYRILNKQYTKNKRVNKLLWFISLILTEIKIPYTAKIGGGLLMPHPKCIYFHSQSAIGENFTISQGVTIGGNLYKTKNGRRSPIIGDNVLLGAGAKVLGPVEVGDNSIIGANAVVVKDIPENSVAAGVPARVVKEVGIPYPELMEKMRGF